jgi:HSP20 family molecular chaperone IbpA
MAYDKFGTNEGADDWSRKIGDLMDEMLNRSFVQFKDCGTWQPSTNVYETVDAYYVCVELSGVEQDSIDVQCTEGRKLTIRGARAQPRPKGVNTALSVHAMEIDEGPFRRDLELPEPVIVDRIEATYVKGFLWVALPRNHRG